MNKMFETNVIYLETEHLKVELTKKQIMDLTLGNIPKFINREIDYVIHNGPRVGFYAADSYELVSKEIDWTKPGIFNYKRFWRFLSVRLARRCYIDYKTKVCYTYDKEFYGFIKEFDNVLVNQTYLNWKDINLR